MRPEGFHEDLSVTLSFNPIIPVPPPCLQGGLRVSFDLFLFFLDLFW